MTIVHQPIEVGAVVFPTATPEHESSSGHDGVSASISPLFSSKTSAPLLVRIHAWVASRNEDPLRSVQRALNHCFSTARDWQTDETRGAVRSIRCSTAKNYHPLQFLITSWPIDRNGGDQHAWPDACWW